MVVAWVETEERYYEVGDTTLYEPYAITRIELGEDSFTVHLTKGFVRVFDPIKEVGYD